MNPQGPSSGPGVARVGGARDENGPEHSGDARTGPRCRRENRWQPVELRAYGRENAGLRYSVGVMTLSRR